MLVRETLDVLPFPIVLELNKVYHLYRNLLALGWKKISCKTSWNFCSWQGQWLFIVDLEKFVTWLSKWALNKAKKEKSQLHILELFLVPGDGLGRLWLALTRLTLSSDPGDHFWSENLVLHTSCPRNKYKSNPYFIFWMTICSTCIATLSSNGFSLLNFSFHVGPCWGLGFCLNIGPFLWMGLAILSAPFHHLGLAEGKHALVGYILSQNSPFNKIIRHWGEEPTL